MSALSIRPRSLKVNSYDDVDNWGDLAGAQTGLAALMRDLVLHGAWDVEKAEYDTSAGQINDTAPIILETQTVTNDSDITQEPEVDLSQSVSETHSFTFTAGFSLSVGASFEVGVPMVADGKISTTVTAKTDFSWGQTTTVTTTVGERIPVKNKPHSTTKVTGTVKRSTIDVPCTLHLRSKVDNTVTTHSNVVYKDLTYWDFAVEYD